MFSNIPPCIFEPTASTLQKRKRKNQTTKAQSKHQLNIMMFRINVQPDQMFVVPDLSRLDTSQTFSGGTPRSAVPGMVQTSHLVLSPGRLSKSVGPHAPRDSLSGRSWRPHLPTTVTHHVVTSYGFHMYSSRGVCTYCDNHVHNLMGRTPLVAALEQSARR